MEKKCEIVQDLIPIVVDKIASDTSIEMVDEHIKNCEECQKVFFRANKPMELVDTLQNLDEKKIIQSVAKKQKRKYFIGIVAAILLTCLGVYLISILKRGITAYTNVEIGVSNDYSTIQLIDAKNAVMKTFRQEFGGCKLLTLSYDEAFSKQYCKADQYDTKKTIVFSSSFYVYPWGGDGSLTKNKTVDYWKWIVQYSPENERWIVVNWGY